MAATDGRGWNPHTERPIIAWPVASRTRRPQRWRIIPVTFAADAPIGLDPATGEILTDDLAVYLYRLCREITTPDDPGVCVVTDRPADLWRYMDERGPAAGAGYRGWGTVRVAQIHTRTRVPEGAALERVTAAFTGFRWGRRRSVLVLDPTAYCDAKAADVIGAHPRDTAEHTLMRLALWAADVVRWCRDAGYHLRPSRGGMGAQALTDARWFPRRRRKVPTWINEIARPHLPGNFYRVMDTRRHADALELDQRGAHHQAAARIAFTDPDTISAVGWIRDPRSARVFMRPTDPAWPDFIRRPGLFFLRVRTGGATGSSPYQLPELSGPAGERTAALWSVELPAVMDDPDIEIMWCVAAIVSEHRDDQDAGEGLNGYARWAWDQLGMAAPNRARWLKGILLSAYGVLAQGPRPMGRFSTEPTPNSVPTVVVLGGALALVHVSVTRRSSEPGYANVCDRGLIEAETRAESRAMARAIDQARAGGDPAQLVAIYADAVLVSVDSDRAGIFAGDAEEHARWARSISRAEWRARPRSQLQMIGEHGYTSDQVVKLPGVPRDHRTDRGDT